MSGTVLKAADDIYICIFNERMLKKDAEKLNEQNNRKYEVQAKFSLASVHYYPHAHKLR